MSEGADELCGYIDQDNYYIYENLKNKTLLKQATLLLNKNSFIRKFLEELNLLIMYY